MTRAKILGIVAVILAAVSIGCFSYYTGPSRSAINVGVLRDSMSGNRLGYAADARQAAQTVMVFGIVFLALAVIAGIMAIATRTPEPSAQTLSPS